MTRPIVKCVAGALAILAAVASSAQDHPRPVQPLRPLVPLQPSRAFGRAWEVLDLLPDSGVAGYFLMHVDFDASGTAWIATGAGLLRYDGYSWRRLTTADGLPSDFVRCVLAADDGTIWVGTDRGAVRWDGTSFAPVPGRGPIGPNVRRISADADGTLWFCCDSWRRPEARMGLSSFRDGVWTDHDRRDGLPDDYVSEHFQDSTGRSFVLTRSGLAVREGDRWATPLADAALPRHDQYLWSIVEDPPGRVVVFGANDAYTLDGDTWTHVSVPASDRDLAKTAVRTDLGIIAAARDRFLAWDGTAWQPVGDRFESTGFPEHARTAPDGSVWCLGHNILLRWEGRDGEWKEVLGVPGPPQVDPIGRLWFTDGQRTMLLEGERWRHAPRASNPLTFEPSGALWTVDGREIRRIAPDLSVTTFAAAETGVAAPVECLASGPDEVWLRGRRHGARFDGAAWRAEARLDESVRAWAPHPKGGICLLHEDDAGSAVTYLTSRGVEWRLPAPEGPLPEPRLHVSGDATVWLFGAFGLRQLEEERWHHVSGLPGTNCRQAIEHGGAVWFRCNGVLGGQGGISRFHEGRWTHFTGFAGDATAGFADGVLLAGIHAFFHARADADSMARVELPVPGHVHGLAVDDTGCIWVNVNHRLYCFAGDGVPPETTIDRGAVDLVKGEPLPLHVFGVERWRPRSASAAQFSWRFDDGPWSPFGDLPDGGLEPPPTPGAHVLEVRARDESLDVDPTPARLEFRVQPVAIQSRAWFLPAVAAVIGVITLLAVVAAVSRRKARRYATELEHRVVVRTAALSASEARLRTVFENIPFEVWFQDRAGRYVMQNAASKRHWGDLVGRDNDEADLPPEVWAKWFACMQRAAAGELVSEETACGCRGDRRVYQTVMAPVLAGDEQIGVLGILVDITARKRDEMRQRLLAAELDHRVKNNLASVLSLIQMTNDAATSRDDFVRRFSGRVLALAQAHEALAAANWQGVELREILQSMLAPGGEAAGAVVHLDGPAITIPAEASGPMSLSLHELATNAVQHGVLPRAGGRLEVTWRRDGDRLEIDWRERGRARTVQDEASEPGAATGTGLRLVQGLIEHQLRGSVRWAKEADGFSCRLEIPLGAGNGLTADPTEWSVTAPPSPLKSSSG